MRKTLLSISVATLLTGCAYAVDTAVQDITIRTPGAVDSVCMMYVDKVKYRVHPPQKISIFRTEADLIIDCLAPGNRRKKVVIEPAYNKSAAGNVATAGVGLAWDYASGALFRYPDVVEVSFIDTPIGAPFIPAQNNPDIRQPEDYDLEEFRPGQPRMNADKHLIKTPLVKRGGGFLEESENTGESFTENADMSGGKGDLKATTAVEVYGPSLNPAENATEAPAPASSEPTPIVPGE